MITEFAGCVAAEGDNTVLSLSAGKGLMSYLNKCISYTKIYWSAFKTGKAPNQSVDYLEGIFDYLAEVKKIINKKEDLLDVNNLREVLRYNIAFNVANAGQKLQALSMIFCTYNLVGEKNLSFREASDKHMGIVLNDATRAQSNYWTMKTFVEELSLLKDKRISAVLYKVCQFYGLMKILETQTQIFEYGILEPQHFKWIKEIRDDLLPVLKDQAIGLSEVYSVQSLLGYRVLRWKSENSHRTPWW